jgi:hypothetical protein
MKKIMTLLILTSSISIAQAGSKVIEDISSKGVFFRKDCSEYSTDRKNRKKNREEKVKVKGLKEDLNRSDLKSLVKESSKIDQVLTQKLTKFLKDHTFQNHGTYTFNRNSVGESKNNIIATRTLVRYYNKRGKLSDHFEDRYLMINVNTNEVLLRWGSFYFKDSSTGLYTNINDEGNDCDVEVKHNSKDDSHRGLRVTFNSKIYPTIHDQVATCAGHSGVKGSGTKSYTKDAFKYSYQFNGVDTCPAYGRDKKVSTYTVYGDTKTVK